MIDILIVGGGQASKHIINYFWNSNDWRIVAVVDLDDLAPGMQRARQLGLITSTDFKATLAERHIDLIIEITGNKKVLELILQTRKPDQHIISSQGAWLMNEFLENYLHKQENTIAARLRELTSQINSLFRGLNHAVTDVGSVLMKMDLLAINGAISAGKLNSHEFTVIAENMGTLAKQVGETMKQILSSAETGQQIIDTLKKTETDLLGDSHRDPSVSPPSALRRQV